MAWMETDYSKHTYFRWKIKWRLENFGALGIMGEMWNVWGIWLYFESILQRRAPEGNPETFNFVPIFSKLLIAAAQNRMLVLPCDRVRHPNFQPPQPPTQNENVCPDNRFDMSDKVQYSKFKLQCRFFDVGLPTMWSEFACPANQNPKRTIKKRKPRYLCAPLKFFKCVRHVW